MILRRNEIGPLIWTCQRENTGILFYDITSYEFVSHYIDIPYVPARIKLDGFHHCVRSRSVEILCAKRHGSQYMKPGHTYVQLFHDSYTHPRTRVKWVNKNALLTASCMFSIPHVVSIFAWIIIRADASNGGWDIWWALLSNWLPISAVKPLP